MTYHFPKDCSLLPVHVMIEKLKKPHDNMTTWQPGNMAAWHATPFPPIKENNECHMYRYNCIERKNEKGLLIWPII